MLPIIIMLPEILQTAMAIAKAMVILGEGMKVLGNALTQLGKDCGLLEENSDIEEIGAKALLAEQDGIKPEDFEKYGDYLDKITKYDVDIKEATKLNEGDKLKKGIEVVSAGLINQFPSLRMGDFLLYTTKNPDYFTAKRMGEFGKLMISNTKGFNDACLYMTGKSKDDQVIGNALDVLKGVEKDINPEISDKESLKNALSSRN